ncbi:MAG: transposase [Acidimicrobiia bacterium]|nr:transposase [Acidimicrobiia bacterium]
MGSNPKLADVNAARRIADVRWPDKIICPHCGSLRTAERARPGRRWPQWRCRDCRGEFTAVTGTSMHGTKTSPSIVERRLSETRQTPYLPATGDSGSTDQVEDPSMGLSAGARSVLNALRQRPAGATVGKISVIAGISERQTRRVLHKLSTAGIALGQDGIVRDGYKSTIKRLWALTYTPECVRLLGYLPRRRAPMSEPSVPGAVPPQFWPLFWSGAEGSELSLERDELHIAGTLIGSMDLSAEAWALRSVSTETLTALAGTRGYDTGDTAKVIRSELRRRSRVAD